MMLRSWQLQSAMLRQRLRPRLRLRLRLQLRSRLCGKLLLSVEMQQRSLYKTLSGVDDFRTVAVQSTNESSSRVQFTRMLP